MLRLECFIVEFDGLSEHDDVFPSAQLGRPSSCTSGGLTNSPLGIRENPTDITTALPFDGGSITDIFFRRVSSSGSTMARAGTISQRPTRDCYLASAAFAKRRNAWWHIVAISEKTF